MTDSIKTWVDITSALSTSKGFSFLERDPITTKRLASAAHLMLSMKADIEKIRNGDSLFDFYSTPLALSPFREYQISCALLIISELLEHIESVFNKDKDWPVACLPPGQKPEGPTVELADTALRLFDYVGKFCASSDLFLSAMSAKHAYNATRPYKHGKKA